MARYDLQSSQRQNTTRGRTDMEFGVSECLEKKWLNGMKLLEDCLVLGV